MINTNTSSTPLILAGSTYTYTENLGGVQIVRYIRTDGPTRPNATTINTWHPYFIATDYYPCTYQMTYK